MRVAIAVVCQSMGKPVDDTRVLGLPTVAQGILGTVSSLYRETRVLLLRKSDLIQSMLLLLLLLAGPLSSCSPLPLPFYMPSQGASEILGMSTVPFRVSTTADASCLAAFSPLWKFAVDVDV